MDKPSNNIPNNISPSVEGINNSQNQNDSPAPVGAIQTIPYTQSSNPPNQIYNQNVPIYQGQKAYNNQQAQPFQTGYTQIPQTIRQQNQVVVLANPVNPGYTGNPPRHSFRTVCPNCNKEVITNIEYETNLWVWLICIFLFFFTVCLWCIPFCINSIKDVAHYCPICNRVIAIHKENV